MRRYMMLLLCVLMCQLTACDLLDEELLSDDAPTKQQESNRQVNSVTAEEIQALFPEGVIRDKKVKLKGNGEDKVTVLIYMNGSNLESESGEATTDLAEMVAAGSSDNVNVLVMTMGTKKWNKKYGIASDHSQIYKVDGDGLTLVKDDMGQKDCTKSKTLSTFIKWGAKKYPADRYILHFWDHGGGPVYGFGYDEWNKDENAALTIDEIQTALKTAGVYFDFVGMDCCLMSCLEVCCAFYDYCDYMILSEDFESGLGWSYTKWLKKLYKNSSIPTTKLGKVICDEMVYANVNEKGGDRSIMAVVDQSMLKVLYTAWTEFAYENEDVLLRTNYSRSVKRAIGGRVHPAIVRGNGYRWGDWNYDFFDLDDYDSEENLSMAEYFVTDIMEVAKSIDSKKADALSAAISATLTYVNSTQSDAGLTGIAVSLPYGDKDYYKNLKTIFTNIGMDETYVKWLKKFVSVEKNTESYDHDSWDDFWEGWDDYENDYDWNDCEYCDDEYDSYWDDDWDDWNYEDSWNWWLDENCDDYYEDYEEEYYDSYYDDYYYDDDCYDDDCYDDGYYDEY